MDTPILFCIFNRPELTHRTFEVIKRQRPKTLLVIADGPRPHVASDVKLIHRTRDVIKSVDWPCDILTNYSEVNLGCKYRMSTGITWAFENYERLIILEDDCLPTDSFFTFCENLLEKYSDQKDVMMISGDNFQQMPRTNHSYYFSKWAHIWGWASWRRAWNTYDVEMASWDNVRNTNQWTKFIDCDEEKSHWFDLFDRQRAGQIDTWDFPWMYACWLNNGLCVLPEKNLVSNLGFHADATHTTDQHSSLAAMRTYPMNIKSHPAEVARHVEADQFTWSTIFKPPRAKPHSIPKQRMSWWQRIKKLAS